MACIYIYTVSCSVLWIVRPWYFPTSQIIFVIINSRSIYFSKYFDYITSQILYSFSKNYLINCLSNVPTCSSMVKWIFLMWKFVTSNSHSYSQLRIFVWFRRNFLITDLHNVLWLPKIMYYFIFKSYIIRLRFKSFPLNIYQSDYQTNSFSKFRHQTKIS